MKWIRQQVQRETGVPMVANTLNLTNQTHCATQSCRCTDHVSPPKGNCIQTQSSICGRCAVVLVFTVCDVHSCRSLPCTPCWHLQLKIGSSPVEAELNYFDWKTPFTHAHFKCFLFFCIFWWQKTIEVVCVNSPSPMTKTTSGGGFIGQNRMWQGVWAAWDSYVIELAPSLLAEWFFAAHCPVSF